MADGYQVLNLEEPEGRPYMHKVYFVDTTLRDGEQAPGVAFSVLEKVNIARLLDKLGVSQIEAGIPVMGTLEVEAVTAIAGLGLNAVVSTWNRMVVGDIKASLACGVKNTHITLPASDIHIKHKLRKDRLWVIENMRRVISYAKEHGCNVTVGLEDASRADQAFLIQLADQARREGALRLRYADTVGVLEPFRTRQVIEQLIKATGMDIEFHGHNDFGMATANTLAAFKGGAKYLSTTITGIGERAGNCTFEEAVAALNHFEKMGLKFDNKLLKQLCAYVGKAAGRVSITTYAPDIVVAN